LPVFKFGDKVRISLWFILCSLFGVH